LVIGKPFEYFTKAGIKFDDEMKLVRENLVMIQDQRKTAHEMIVANDTLTKLIENIR
jgi:hypothetical protein